MNNGIIIHPFKERTVGYYIGFAAAVLAVLGAVVYAIVDFGDKSFSLAAFVIMLVGGLSFAGVMLVNIPPLAIIPAIMYVLGFALALNAALPPLSDVWNGVNFIGGNAYAGLAFTIIFAVSAITGIVAAFMNQGKKSE